MLALVSALAVSTAAPGLLILFLSEFRTNKPSDVISTLVSIYDSKDLFVKELQVLLAQRLLAITDGNFDKEVSHVQVNHAGINTLHSVGTLRS